MDGAVSKPAGSSDPTVCFVLYIRINIYFLLVGGEFNFFLNILLSFSAVVLLDV